MCKMGLMCNKIHSFIYSFQCEIHVKYAAILHFVYCIVFWMYIYLYSTCHFLIFYILYFIFYILFLFLFYFIQMHRGVALKFRCMQYNDNKGDSDSDSFSICKKFCSNNSIKSLFLRWLHCLLINILSHMKLLLMK